jgi:hypothetical protein
MPLPSGSSSLGSASLQVSSTTEGREVQQIGRSKSSAIPPDTDMGGEFTAMPSEITEARPPSVGKNEYVNSCIPISAMGSGAVGDLRSETERVPSFAR